MARIHDLGNVYTEDVRVIVEGAENGHRGYGITYIPEGAEGRQVTKGPMVPGPWASLYGMAGVMAADPRAGTAAEIRREEAEGRLFRVTPGDVMILPGGYRAVVKLGDRGYPKLIDEPGPSGGPLHRRRSV